MNELARLVDFFFEQTKSYRIVDRNGKPWFVVKDICRILGIKNPSKAVRDFPPDYVTTIFTITKSYSEGGRVHKVLIINEAGLLRLITRSNKPVARRIQDKIFEEILPAYRKHGINRASLPKVWPWRGQMYNHAEYLAKKEEAYFKRFPDADFDDFLKTLPQFPPEPPEEGEKSG
jgi:prophage antirepressor-like protein